MTVPFVVLFPQTMEIRIQLTLFTSRHCVNAKVSTDGIATRSIN